MPSPIGLDFYDAQLRAHHEHLRAAYGIGRGDEVLDIGCGTELTTREAGRAAAPGRVVGGDVSVRMLERARELTALVTVSSPGPVPLLRRGCSSFSRSRGVCPAKISS